jgi:hypothetical protein
MTTLDDRPATKIATGIEPVRPTPMPTEIHLPVHPLRLSVSGTAAPPTDLNKDLSDAIAVTREQIRALQVVPNPVFAPTTDNLELLREAQIRNEEYRAEALVRQRQREAEMHRQAMFGAQGRGGYCYCSPNRSMYFTPRPAVAAAPDVSWIETETGVSDGLFHVAAAVGALVALVSAILLIALVAFI